MAEIDIQEKRGGAGWIWWALGLLVLAAILWWLMAGNDRDDELTGTGATVPAVPMTADQSVAPAVVDATPITDFTLLTGATTSSDLAGRRVALTALPVASVVSDKGFWAGSGTAQGSGVFVVRGNQHASYTAPDGAVDKGKQVNIYGTVQAMPANLTDQSTEWNLGSTDKQALSTRPIYISADSVRIAQ